MQRRAPSTLQVRYSAQIQMFKNIVSNVLPDTRYELKSSKSLVSCVNHLQDLATLVMHSASGRVSSYTPVSQTSCVAKNKILHNRPFYRIDQAGFRKNRSCEGQTRRPAPHTVDR